MEINKNTELSAQMKKGVLEYCILAIINGKEVYATDILNQLKDANLLVVEGTLYPLLTRMKNNNYLTYQWKESSSGPPRKYFQITELGIQFLDELDASWRELVQSVSLLTQDSIKTI